MGKTLKELEEEFENEEIRSLQSKHLHHKQLPSNDLHSKPLHGKEKIENTGLQSKQKKPLPCKPTYSKNRVRNIQKKIYFSADEWALAQVKLNNQRLSTYIRRNIFDERACLLGKPELVKLSRELSALGNNLNQLTKRANEIRGISRPEDLINLLQDVRSKLLQCKQELEQ